MFEKNKEEEEWRTIPENENYEVSNFAQIRNKKMSKRILKKQINDAGYEKICLFLQNKVKNHLVHRLVALAFISNPNDFPVVNHKDRNRRNNRVENLEWVTRSMNILHSYETGRNTYKRAVWRRDSKDKDKKVKFESITEAAKAVDCKPHNIYDCLRGRQKTTAGFEWEYVEEKIKEEARKDIASFEIKDYPDYRIYNNGQIYTEKSKKYLKPRISGGYCNVDLFNDNGRKSHSVHRLVAEYFCDNPENKRIVNHRDGNKLNNHYTNLEYVTYSENSRHAHNLGLIKRVSKCVHQYAREDKDKLEPLRAFSNNREVAEFVKLKSKSKTKISIMKSISRACRGERETAYGYRWGYAKEIL